MFLKCEWVFTWVEMLVKRGWDFSPVFLVGWFLKFFLCWTTTDGIYTLVECVWGFTEGKVFRGLSVGMITPGHLLLDDYTWNFYTCKAWVRLHQGWVCTSYLSRWSLQYNRPYVHIIAHAIRMPCKTRVRFHPLSNKTFFFNLRTSEMWRSFPPFLINKCCLWNQILPRHDSLTTIYVKCDFRGGLCFFANCTEFGTPHLSGWHIMYHVVLFCACIIPSVGVLIDFYGKIYSSFGVTSKANRFSTNVIWIVLFRVSLF